MFLNKVSFKLLFLITISAAEGVALIANSMVPKQKKGAPRVKPYEKPNSEQPNDNDTQKDSDHEIMSYGEQRLNGLFSTWLYN